MKICVTGATGFVGNRFVEMALARGHQVTCLVRDVRKIGSLPTGARVILGDLAQTSALEQFVADADVVVHLAARSCTGRPDSDLYTVNVEGTDNLCRAILARNQQCVLVHCSSLAVLARHRRMPWLNTSHTRSKTEGLRPVARAEEAGLKAIYVFPGLVYGPGERRLFPLMLRAARSRWRIEVSGGERWAPLVYVDDLCDLLLHCSENGEALAGRPFAAVGNLEVGMHEVVRRIAAEFDLPRPAIRLPRSLLFWLALAAEAVRAASKPRRTSLLSRRTVNVLSMQLDPDVVRQYNGNDWRARHSWEETWAPTMAWLRQLDGLHEQLVGRFQRHRHRGR